MVLDYWCHNCRKQVSASVPESDGGGGGGGGPACDECGGGFIERHDATDPQTQETPNNFMVAPEANQLFQQLQQLLQMPQGGLGRQPPQANGGGGGGGGGDGQPGGLNGSGGQPRAQGFPFGGNGGGFRIPGGGGSYVSFGFGGGNGPFTFAPNLNGQVGEGAEGGDAGDRQGNAPRSFVDFLRQLQQQMGQNNVDLDDILNRSMNDAVRGPPPATQDSIESLKVVKMTPELVATEASCPVCMVDFEEGEEATELPCAHLFHGGCITQWLKLHNTCPVCRATLPSVDDEAPAATAASSSSSSSSFSSTSTSYATTTATTTAAATSPVSAPVPAPDSAPSPSPSIAPVPIVNLEDDDDDGPQ